MTSESSISNSIFAALPHTTIVIDGAGAIRYASEEASRLFGYGLTELIGQPVEMLIPGRLREGHHHHRDGYMRDPQARPMGTGLRVSAVTKSGKEFPADIALSPTRVGDDEQLLVIASVRDVSEETDRAEALALSLAMVQAVAPSPSLAQAVQATLTPICETTGFDFGSAWLASPDGRKLSFVDTAYGDVLKYAELTNAYRSAPITKGEGLVGRVWQTKRYEWVEAIEANLGSSRSRIAYKAGIRGALAVPVITSGEVVAIFLLCEEQRHNLDEAVVSRVTSALAELGPVYLRMIANDSLRSSLEQNQMLVREVHHRVKNNLAVITSLLHMQSVRAPDEISRATLADSESRIRSMALVHERMYQSDNLAEIDFGDYLRALCQQLQAIYSRVDGDVRIMTHAQSIQLGVNQAIPCGLIIQELVTNSLKYGFPSGTGGNINVGLSENVETESYVLSVQDDGVGLREGLDIDASDSLGYSLIKSLTGQLRGTLEVGGISGVTVRITFPMTHDNGN